MNNRGLHTDDIVTGIQPQLISMRLSLTQLTQDFRLPQESDLKYSQLSRRRILHRCRL